MEGISEDLQKLLVIVSDWRQREALLRDNLAKFEGRNHKLQRRKNVVEKTIPKFLPSAQPLICPQLTQQSLPNQRRL